MQATISKDFEFSASHTLSGLDDGHKCSRLHGHNYIIRISLIGYVIEPGFVVDYSDLNFVKDIIDKNFDHQNLNSVLDFNPTAENIAKYFIDILVDLIKKNYSNVINVSVSVSETPKTWATVFCDIDN